MIQHYEFDYTHIHHHSQKQINSQKYNYQIFYAFLQKL